LAARSPCIRRRGRRRFDVLVSNAAAQWPQDTVEEIDLGQLGRTLRTNIFSYFLFTQAALPHMHNGASVKVKSFRPGRRT
jgi:NAD(P)-dependent dehydrogenase (short-subunit alcohol dehydrogenase family)